jgi:hypothetical protein
VKLPEFRSTLAGLFKGATATAPAAKPDLEQMKEVIESAVEFDKLVVMSGWEKALKYCVAEVNSEVAEATKYKYEPIRQAVHVTRWDAKRELLDGLLGYISKIQRDRDDIIEQIKAHGKDLQDVA